MVKLVRSLSVHWARVMYNGIGGFFQVNDELYNLFW